VDIPAVKNGILIYKATGEAVLVNNSEIHVIFTTQ
jgi:hypothetical protein